LGPNPPGYACGASGARVFGHPDGRSLSFGFPGIRRGSTGALAPLPSCPRQEGAVIPTDWLWPPPLSLPPWSLPWNAPMATRYLSPKASGYYVPFYSHLLSRLRESRLPARLTGCGTPGLPFYIPTPRLGAPLAAGGGGIGIKRFGSKVLSHGSGGARWAPPFPGKAAQSSPFGSPRQSLLLGRCYLQIATDRFTPCEVPPLPTWGELS
jgi:hypothetical protein